VRDAISLLDQVKNVNDSVTVKDVERMMGLASDDVLNGLLLSIANGDLRSLSETLTDAKVFGVSDIILASQISHAIRNGHV
jgi:DNA polymerase III gamma/tau subunit